jgi:hypothetical protein
MVFLEVVKPLFLQIVFLCSIFFRDKHLFGVKSGERDGQSLYKRLPRCDSDMLIPGVVL